MRKCEHSFVSDHTTKSCISLVPIFNHLDKEKMDEIMEKVHHKMLQKGETLYRAGDESDSLYIVQRGKIKIYRLSETGKEQIVRILFPGDFTGELALFKQSVHDSYAEALIETSICQIQRKDLQQFLLKYPSISLEILKELSNRLDQSEKQVTRFATEKVDTRIALFLAEYANGEERMEFTLPMSKKDLASYLGTTPETISRKLAEFEDAGILRQKSNKRIKILDINRLQSII